MTDRDVYSLIEAVVRDGKRRINDADRGLVSQLLGSYQDARNTIAAELMTLEEQILWSIANNPDEITAAWIRRQDWYEQLDRAIQTEATRLEDMTRGLTIDGRAAGIAEGSVTGVQTFRAMPWMGTNPQVVEHWIAAIQPGSPLDRVLSRYGAEVEGGLRDGITQGLIERQGSGNIVRTIIADVGELIPTSDASRIVRTETMRAYRGVYRDQMDALPQGMVAGYRWLAALDSRTCPICMGLHNHIFPEYPDYQHVMCFPAGTEVNGPLAQAATKRWYEGKLVEITTAGNQRLSVTPNHPILTPRGWVAAGELVEGDDVFRHLFPQGETTAINPDHKRRPTFIEEVAKSLMDSGDGIARQVPGSPVDFHGDGAYGEVNIVSTNSLLGDARNAAIFNPFLQQEFFGSGVGEISLAGLRRAYQRIERFLSPSASLVSGLGQFLSLLFGGLGHSHVHGFGSTARLYPGLDQLESYSRPLAIKPSGDGQFGHAFQIPFRDLRGAGTQVLASVLATPSTPHGNPSLLEDGFQTLGGDSESLTAVLERLAGEVVTDKVTHLRLSEFAGHVYNLETTEGWYSANSILTHNCRCVVLPHFSERYAPPREFETGDEWLMKQPEDVQVSVLGPSRHELWRDGGVPMRDMVRFETDPVWGGSARLVPVRSLRP